MVSHEIEHERLTRQKGFGSCLHWIYLTAREFPIMLAWEICQIIGDLSPILSCVPPTFLAKCLSTAGGGGVEKSPHGFDSVMNT